MAVAARSQTLLWYGGLRMNGTIVTASGSWQDWVFVMIYGSITLFVLWRVLLTQPNGK